MAIHGFPGGVISATPPTISPSGASGVWTLDEQLQAGANWPVAPAFLTNSVRFRASASAYLRRTPTVSSDRRTWTFSCWFKRGSLATGAQQALLSVSDGTSFPVTGILITDVDRLRIASGTALVSDIEVSSTQVFRDPSAWYHLVVAIDTTQATSTNRVRAWANGVQVALNIDNILPAQNYQTMVNNTGFTHNIGAQSLNGLQRYFDGYITDVNFIDGQALTPNYFGTVDAATGVWEPATYRGSYGTNGFYLPFTNTASTTTLGNDFSGNGNNWTTNNISLTAGATYDSMTDVPTLTSATASNFATFNPLMNFSGAFSATPTLSQANLLASGVADTKQYYADSTIQVSSGKWYAEFTPSTVTGDSSYVGIVTSSYLALYAPTGNYYNNSSWASYGATYTTGDVIGVAYDADAGTITFYKNGVSQGQKTGITGTNALFRTSSYNTGASHSWTANFGQRGFAYTPPTGFVALNTFNLPTPTIGATASTQAINYMGATTYSGDSTSNRVITTGGGSQFVWIKRRNSATNNILFDVIRGAGATLYSNLTNAEAANGSFYVQQFGNTGFTLGTGGDAADNITGGTYVAWNWNGGTSTVTNTSGSISSQVRANPTAGFSIVTYTGTGANATVGHGLGVAPKMVIIKSRSTSDFWVVWQTALSGTEYLLLNSTNGKSTAATYFNSTTPSSTVFSLGSDSRPNGNGTTYVAYCFSEVAGYSAMGSYTGNSSADGTFIYTGFRPAYVLRKRIDSTSDWVIADDARNPSNEVTSRLYANVNDAEGGEALDFLSNGFKNKADGALNTSGGTYIYMAFAEFPFKYANAR